MKILALDLATNTGWAADLADLNGVQNFALKRGESPGMRYLRFTAWLKEILALVQPEVVYYEQAHHRGGHATEIAAGLATHLQSTLAAAGIEHVAVHTSRLKKHATGRGNAGKPEMIRAAESLLGREPIDDDHADAVCLLHYAVSEMGG